MGYFRTRLRQFRAVGVFVAALIAVLALQAVVGAFTAPIGGHPDEPAHVVTALMYRQFLLAPTADPLLFAKNYYSHYPFVAAGHWPPMAHLLAAIWTIFAGVGKVQFVLYLTLAGALTGMLLFRSILTIGSAWLAAAFVGIWMLLAESQAAFSLFTTEAPLTLLTLAAVVVYVRYLRNPSYRLALLFALLASAAILTKETAVALAFVPPLAVAGLRQWSLLRKGHFWLPALLVTLIVAPWHFWIAEVGIGRFRGGVVQRMMIDGQATITERLAQVPALLGWPLLVIALFGLVARLAAINKQRDSSPIWIAHAGLLAGGLAVLLFAPESREVRHLYQLSPSLVLFAAAGAWALTQRLRGSLRTPAAVLVGLSCVFSTPVDFARAEKASAAPYDPRSIARYLCSNPEAEMIFISTNGHTSEGPLIAEVALLEPAPTRHLVRGSKTTYQVSWDGNGYHTLIPTLPDLENFIDSSGIDTIVRLAGQPHSPQPHEAMLALAISDHPNDWAPVPIDFPNDAQVYRRTTAANTARQPIRIPMSSKLGEDLTVEPDSADVPPKQRH